MILVDVYVPAVLEKFNFSLAEDIPIYMLIEEMTEMIAQKGQRKICGTKEKFLLCDNDAHVILSLESTLLSNGIRTGSRLILL